MGEATAQQRSNEVGRLDQIYLRQAAQHGDLAKLQEILDKGVPVDTILDHGATPLLLAAQYGRDAIIRELLKSGAEVLFRRESDGATPLVAAINSGNAAAVDLLLDRRVALDVSPKKPPLPLQVALFFVTADETANVIAEVLDQWVEKDEQATPLRIAFSEAHLDVLRVLVDRQEAVQWAEFSLEVALFVACQAGKVEVVQKLLLDREVNPNFRSEEGVSPLANAFYHGKSGVVALLLEHQRVSLEIELCFVAEDGETSVVAKLVDREVRRSHDEEDERSLSLPLSEAHLDVLSVLLDKKGKVTWRELSLEVALLAAARFGHVDLVTKLLQRQPNIHFRTESGETPLLVACLSGHEEIVRVLLDKGDTGEAGWSEASLVSPLRVAVENGHTQIAALLISHGANVNIPSEYDGVTPLVAASRHAHHDVVSLLLKKRAVVDWGKASPEVIAFVAAESGHSRVIHEFLDQGGDANTSDKNGVSLLQVACSSRQRVVAAFLLARGALVDLRSDGIAQLMIASQKGDAGIVATLLEYGASVDLKEDSQGVTALHMAAQNGHADVVRALLEYGANVELRRNDGVGPLALAASNGHVDVVDTLLDARSARERVSDDSPENALLYAAQAGHAQVISALIARGANPSFANQEGVTPLAAAAQSGHLEIVKALLNQKEKVSEDSQGMALLVAAQFGHINVVVELLDGGVDVNFSSKGGVTALQIAEASGFAELATILREWEPIET